MPEQHEGLVLPAVGVVLALRAPGGISDGEGLCLLLGFSLYLIAAGRLFGCLRSCERKQGTEREVCERDCYVLYSLTIIVFVTVIGLVCLYAV